MKRRRTGGLALVVASIVGVAWALAPHLVGPSEAGTNLAQVGTIEPGLIHPTRGDIRSVLVLDGVVTVVEPILLRARAAGVVAAVANVTGILPAGTTLATIGSGGDQVRVQMPESGVVLATDIVKGQEVARGDQLFVVAPSRYRITVPVDPAVLYRLYKRPLTITVAIDRGPAPFECPFVSVGATPATGSNPLEAQVLLVCAVPPETRVFAGIRAQVAVTTATATNALLLPVEAVEGAADRGTVTVLAEGQRLPRSVELGITDGARVEILSGLTEADQVLEFPASRPVASGTAQP